MIRFLGKSHPFSKQNSTVSHCRVIVRAPYVGRDALQSSQYRQMIGRAGRAGIDSSGESILIVNKKDEKKVSLYNVFSV